MTPSPFSFVGLLSYSAKNHVRSFRSTEKTLKKFSFSKVKMGSVGLLSIASINRKNDIAVMHGNEHGHRIPAIINVHVQKIRHKRLGNAIHNALVFEAKISGVHIHRTAVTIPNGVSGFIDLHRRLHTGFQLGLLSGNL